MVISYGNEVSEEVVINGDWFIWNGFVM